MAIVESLEMRKRLCCGSIERELQISRKVIKELLKIPEALMEKLTKWTDLNCFLSSDEYGQKEDSLSSYATGDGLMERLNNSVITSSYSHNYS